MTNNTLSGLGDLANLGEMLETTSDKTLEKIPVEQIYSKSQPRKVFERIDELADSLRAIGQQQPIVVNPDGNGRYIIEQGERRWRAAKKAKLETLYCIVTESDENDDTRVVRQLAENIQREDMKLYELITAVSEIISTGMTIRELSKKLGKKESYISTLNSLSNLPSVLQELVVEEKVKDPIGLKKLAKLYEIDRKKVCKQIRKWNKIPKDAPADYPTPSISRTQIAQFEAEMLNKSAPEGLVTPKTDSTHTEAEGVPQAQEQAQEQAQDQAQADGVQETTSAADVPPTETFPELSQEEQTPDVPADCVRVSRPIKVYFEYEGQQATMVADVLPPTGKLCLRINSTGEIKVVGLTEAQFVGISG